MADYTTELQTGLIGLRWLHKAKFRGAGLATMALEEQGKTGMAWLATAMAGRGYQLRPQTRTGYRMMGKRPTCSGQWAARP